MEELGGRGDWGTRNLTFGLLETLGRAIVTGAYESERFPTEAELAAQHMVSRSVTREAVKMLTAKGLLTARPRKGTTVQPAVLLEPVRHRRPALAARAQILARPASPVQRAQDRDRAGGGGARRARRRSRRRRRDRAGLSRGWRRPRPARDDPLESDIAFHIAVLEACGNPFYHQFRDVVATALRTSIRFTNRFKGRTASLPAHHAVLEAIQAADPDGARAAMAAIIDDVDGPVRRGGRTGLGCGD